MSTMANSYVSIILSEQDFSNFFIDLPRKASNVYDKVVPKVLVYEHFREGKQRHYHVLGPEEQLGSYWSIAASPIDDIEFTLKMIRPCMALVRSNNIALESLLRKECSTEESVDTVIMIGDKHDVREELDKAAQPWFKKIEPHDIEPDFFFSHDDDGQLQCTSLKRKFLFRTDPLLDDLVLSDSQSTRFRAAERLREDSEDIHRLLEAHIICADDIRPRQLFKHPIYTSIEHWIREIKVFSFDKCERGMKLQAFAREFCTDSTFGRDVTYLLNETIDENESFKNKNGKEKLLRERYVPYKNLREHVASAYVGV